MSAMKTLYIDYSKCIGCETCEFVCRFVHATPRIVMTRTTDGIMMPLYCRHCEDPNCARVCKKGAITRDAGGAMVLQPLLCRGCEGRNCMLACPYAAMFETDKGVMLTKCDLCAERRGRGMGPACADMCPCGAIFFVETSELEALRTPEAVEAEARVLAHIKPPSKKD
ncbi:4Fe-4S dicluster domain-containing protein [Fundidesulfovibrio terrae]|uniref:4Fe-4S dicluster domain-containing protein n=1 Tax=Fundidesulfovibrio terrae TaxID=2922866 RepID=UPI001FAF70BA|nr:4Fe-4S dicluster domain-containing protein [Fundidesulfovibrio terrae]